MNNEVFERIDRLMKEKGKKYQDLNDYLGVNRMTYSNWKSGKSKSFEKYIDWIADFLNVKPAYLAYGIDNPQTIQEKEQEDEFLRLFRKAGKDSVLILLNAATTR